MPSARCAPRPKKQVSRTSNSPSERASEIKRLEKARERLETQVGIMRQLIAKKSADIEQEKSKTQSLERALKQIQAALETERKIRVKVEKSNKETIELAQKRARRDKAPRTSQKDSRDPGPKDGATHQRRAGKGEKTQRRQSAQGAGQGREINRAKNRTRAKTGPRR